MRLSHFCSCVYLSFSLSLVSSLFCLCFTYSPVVVSSSLGLVFLSFPTHLCLVVCPQLLLLVSSVPSVYKLHGLSQSLSVPYLHVPEWLFAIFHLESLVFCFSHRFNSWFSCLTSLLVSVLNETFS